MRLEATNWKLDGGKVIILFQHKDETIEVEVSEKFIKEIILEMPPSEEQHIRELIDMIHVVRKKRLLKIADIDEKIDKIIEREQDAQKAAYAAGDKLEVKKIDSVIKSLKGEKTAQDSRRHLCRLLYQEEGELRARLGRLLAGKE